MELYGLSNETNDALQRLLRASEPTTVGQGAGSGGSRQVVHVRVTAGDTDGFYPCVPTQYNSLTNLWEEYTASVCFAPNDETLTAQRYLAIRYGLRPSDGKAVYVVVGASSSSVSSPDCTALAYLDPTTDCLAITSDLTLGTGRCSEFETNQFVSMVENGSGVWVGTDLFKTPGTHIRTTDCAGCPSGMPFTWLLTVPTGCPFGLTGDWQLAYTGSCTWNQGALTLVLSSGTFTLTRASDTFEYSGTLTDCIGDNILTKVDGGACSSPPSTLTIKPQPAPSIDWTPQFTPPNCTIPYPQLQLVKDGGSGTRTVVCLTWMGCGSNGHQFVGGGPDMCGGDSGGPCNSGAFIVSVGCGCNSGSVSVACYSATATVPKILACTISDPGESIDTVIPLIYNGETWQGYLCLSGGDGPHFALVNLDQCPTIGEPWTFRGATFDNTYNPNNHFYIWNDTETPSVPFAMSGTAAYHEIGGATLDTITYSIAPWTGLPPVGVCCASETDGANLTMLVTGGWEGGGADVLVTLTPGGNNTWTGSNDFTCSTDILVHTIHLFLACCDSHWIFEAYTTGLGLGCPFVYRELVDPPTCLPFDLTIHRSGLGGTADIFVYVA
jgi:hypothetical protein